MSAADRVPEWFLPLFPVFFAGMWVAVSVILSFAGGWRALSRAYPVSLPPSGRSFNLKSGRLGMTNYNGCLRFVAGAPGLGLSILFLFRVGHPPLFVPWSDVSVEFRKAWLGAWADFSFAKCPGVRLRVSRGLGERLLAEGGNVVRTTEAA